MGVGFTFDCRWLYPVRSPRQSHRRRCAYSLSLLPEGIASSQKSVSKSYTCSLAALTIDRGSSLAEEASETKKNLSSAPKLFRITESLRREDAISCSPDYESLQFSYLLENLHRIEGIIVHSDVGSLERDILIQIGRLGALELFYSSLPRTISKPDCLYQSTLHAYHFKEIHVDLLGDEKKPDYDVIVHSRKKQERKLRRKRARADVSEISVQPLSLNGGQKVEISITGSDCPGCPDRLTSSSYGNTNPKHHIARNESKLSMGVKDVAELEKIYMKIEERIGRPVSFVKWAEAAGIDQKSLRRRLHFGWHCRDKLLRNTHSLIAYLAKNYKGMGLGFDDLIQAGKVGVLLGAERFDSSRGYRFSTYVRYWIKKSICSLLSQHSRENRIPESMPYVPVENPSEVVLRQHVRSDIHKLLAGLHPRERQVICLRYGIHDGRCRSLSEIGRLAKVSKEWIRRIEKTAFLKLRNEKTQEALKYYVHLLQL